MDKKIPLHFEDDRLILMDQRYLPQEIVYYTATTYKEVYYSIKEMVIRGAPAIGITAAYGVYLGARESAHLSQDDFSKKMKEVCHYLASSRPTAVNLFYALHRMERRLAAIKERPREDVLLGLLEEAHAINHENSQLNKAIARYGVQVVPQGATILTHCNTGPLATVSYGTALGVIIEAHYQGKDIKVYANETRPRLQGARLTAWELIQEKIPVTLVVDSASALLLKEKRVDLILLGADTIASNGDVANKVGTFMLSVLAKEYNIPFYSVAPTTTFDFSIKGGEEIVIEERCSQEVTHILNHPIAPEEVEVYNPAFDVTPAEHITGIITEKGILYPPLKESIAQLAPNL